MKQQHSVDRTVGSTISWTAGSDVTKTKKKKGKGKKKVTVTVKCESFFNFFETIEPSKDSVAKPNDDSEEEDENPEMVQLEDDFDLGTTIRDNLVPLALEYYLGVIEQADGDSDDDGDMDDDSDEDDEKPKPKPAKKGGAKKDEAKPDEGKQECK